MVMAAGVESVGKANPWMIWTGDLTKLSFSITDFPSTLRDDYIEKLRREKNILSAPFCHHRIKSSCEITSFK